MVVNLKNSTVSKIMLLLLLSGLMVFAFEFNVKPAKAWTGTVYIRADGSIDPPDAPIITYDNITYTLSGNITSYGDGIVVERDNIIIDGAGYVLQGNMTGMGVDFSYRSNVTVKNIQIRNFNTGICIRYSSGITISNNNVIANSEYGIWLGGDEHKFSSNNTIIGNNITNNQWGGIRLYWSSSINVSGNTVANSNGSCIWLKYSSNIHISGNAITNNENGIEISQCSNNSVNGNSIRANSGYGIRVYSSSNNTITGNSIMYNEEGIYLERSLYNEFYNNTITDNGDGIWLSGTENILYNNTLANNGCGILLSQATDNIIYRNLIANNAEGINISPQSFNNSMYDNCIRDNDYGIEVWYSSNNEIFHNNFVNNSQQVINQSPGYINVWDNGYPSGGNYWSDYTGIDEKSGLNQDQPGSDGICDTTYAIDANNTDRYPLMAPISIFEAGVWNETEYFVDVISNSTVSDFNINVTEKTLSFNVTGIEGAAGFCRITIPNIIVQDLWQGGYTVLFNGEPWPYRNWTDATNTYIYVNYTHSEHQIVIIPEFPSITTLLLMLIVISIIASVKRKVLRKFPT